MIELTLEEFEETIDEVIERCEHEGQIFIIDGNIVLIPWKTYQKMKNDTILLEKDNL